jgi:hypothetical protein
MAIIRFRQSGKKLQQKHTILLTDHQETAKELVKALNFEERFVKALGIEGINELEKTVELGKELEEYVKNVDSKLLPTDFQNVLTAFKSRVNSTAQYLDIVAHRATAYLQLDISTIQLKTLIDQALEELQLKDLEVIPAVIMQTAAQLETKTIETDSKKIKRLLVHAILYAQAQGSTPKATILFGIEKSVLGYAMNSIQGYVKQVPAIRFTITTASQLPRGEELYFSSMEQSTLPIPLDTDTFYLLSTQRTLQAHYGYMAVEMGEGNVTQVYVIPQRIRDVRPKEMDAPEFEPDAELRQSDETYPGAVEQEADFLKTLKIDTREELRMVHKAIRLIKKYHGPVKRKSGEPFYLHPITVAKIVSTYTDDLNTILGALLHDVVEDTALTLPQIELMFNEDVKRIVDGVTHLDSRQKTIYKLQLATHENIRQLLELEDKRVLYVKLADRMHNMRTIQFHSSLAKQKGIAEETLQFFVPLAQYLGLSQAAGELKARSFDVLNQEEKK